MRARGNSKDGAAGFLELRSGGRIQAPGIDRPSNIGGVKQEAANSRRRIRSARLQGVPVKWKYVESQVPGCWRAWQLQVGFSYDETCLGTTGQPLKVVMIQPSCQASGRHLAGCYCHVFDNGTWQRAKG